MKGKIFLFLFALPFFGVGVWMGYSIASNFSDAWQMRSWQPTQASLQRAGYETHSGDDSDTYEAFAEYTYQVGGTLHYGNRVGISGGADNIGDYQRDIGSYLSGLRNRGEAVTVYVNPDDATEAVVDRSLRWGLIGFKSIFFFVFGGVGLGLMIWVLRAPQARDLSDPKFKDAPWLANDDWQGGAIKSDSRMSMWGSWAFAAFWNLISAPLPFLIYPEVTEKDNWPALIGLLFPLVGILLLVWAVRSTLEWRRFGPAPLSLDPFPGAIGGHVGGTIDLNLPYDPNAEFSLTLTNLHSYVSGSGKSRSRKESAEWQDTQVAHVTRGPDGTRLGFRFDVPEHLSESDADQSEDAYYLWRLHLNAELPGVDVDRNYEIPVYATGRRSAHLSDLSVEQARSEQEKIDVKAIEKQVNVHYAAGGPVMIYPMGRNLPGGLVGLVIGAIFAGAGWWLLRYEGHPFMGGIFGLVGMIAVIISLYSFLNSLEVSQFADGIRTVRRVLGIAVKRMQMRRSDFVKFTKHATLRTNSGSKHVIHYTISAIDRHGQKMVVGEGFKGSNQARAAVEMIGSLFGLRESDDARVSSEPDEEYDLLAAD
ncbi:MAG: DUF3592 domain-containing protein [Woeseiaceae bacterium]|nr:DUF3592 domain-containing protein [Woeseiaceae bacterium]